MPKDKPEIRFAGYTDAWEKRKLGDNIIQYNEHTIENNQYPVFTSSRKGLFFQKDYYDGHQIASVDNTGYNIVPKGYFTYRHMSDDLIFKFNINDLADYGIVSTLYPVFTTTENLDAMYLMYQLNEGTEFKRFSLLQKQGGSRTYMYFSKLKELKLTIPNIKEQKSISELFKQLDSLITVNQRKVDLLKELKKGFLQKMFPKNGEDKPEIRFAGYTDAWEKRKFGELYRKVNEKNDLTFDNSKVISVANMYFKENSVYKSTEDYMKTYNVFRLGDIAFEGNKSKKFSYGRFVENTIGDGIVSHVFDVFRPISDYDLQYWKYAIHNEGTMGRVLMTATTSSTMMTNLVAKDFLKRTILVPSLAEQQEIGSFIDELDNLITVNQRRVDLLKQEKKALLQKMFV